jgi:hypothetical protein
VASSLAVRLRGRFGPGFSTSNLKYCRLFYLAYPGRTPTIRHGSRDKPAGPREFVTGPVTNPQGGAGFAFVGRQKHLSIDGEDFYIDLACYNYLLKFHLLVDLKLGKLTHQDVGQIDTYVRLYDEEVRTSGDGPTIGLILCAQKNEAVARYSVLRESRQIFAAKYVLYLPAVEELERELRRERDLAEAAREAAAEYLRAARTDLPAP